MKMATSALGVPNEQLRKTQEQVDDVVDIMRNNLDKVMERDAKLSDLDERATQLQEGALVFEKQATSLKRKQWWRNMKMRIILGVVFAVVILIIVLRASV
ncbi:Vesicle-associated membrane protein 1 [Tropilaelaps mercedesae]|uniref:Vesicle-associated membrane protein 1 n=1 Tax=Tropilaelaps mercedesae TaxID=418985 RepID=A0A1V9X6T8_9ACAR|nr:Vesicle-associated membrane protein 1 [Tropilaelaps mercedesae]